MAVSGSKRRKFIRNPERVEEIMLAAMNRLREQHGDEFRAPISDIMDALDKRLKALPSRATAYRALLRLEQRGHFKISRKGERGNYTYSFAGAHTPAPSVTATSPTPEKTSTPVAASADISVLIAEERNLDTQIEQMMAQLRARVEEKRAKLAALEGSLTPEREVVAA